MPVPAVSLPRNPRMRQAVFLAALAILHALDRIAQAVEKNPVATAEALRRAAREKKPAPDQGEES